MILYGFKKMSAKFKIQRVLFKSEIPVEERERYLSEKAFKVKFGNGKAVSVEDGWVSYR